MKQMSYPLITTALLFGHVAVWSATSMETNQATSLGDSVSPVNQTTWMLAGILPQDGEALYEIEFWNSIKDSKNAEDYEAYLKTYPNGRFAPLAKVRAQRYRKEPEQSEQPTETTEQTETETTVGFVVDELNAHMEAATNTNIRKEPSSNANRVGILAEGQTIEVTGRVVDRDWYRINNPAGGQGYVYAPLLKKPKPPVKAEPTPKAPPPTPVAKTIEQKVEPPKKEPPVVKPKQVVAAGESFKDCSTCPEMVAFSPGQFVMGDDKGDRSERPAHRVRISKPFALGKYEVTVGQWSECVKAGACKSVSDNIKTSDNAPIRDVSWLRKITGERYRLPTEAEWEHANRAGTTTTYWWGNKMVPGKANCKDCGGQWDQKLPAEIGSYAANPHGLYDMNGNVWEWVSDCWHDNYQGAPSDGESWDDPNCSVKVIRGGAWRNDKTYVHSASRFKYDTYVRYLLNGFRVAKSMD